MRYPASFVSGEACPDWVERPRTTFDEEVIKSDQLLWRAP
jgi:hypothetical protein